MNPTDYCPACDQTVETEVDSSDGAAIVRCQFCTLPLPGKPSAAAPPVAAAHFPRILLAEDNALLRQMSADSLQRAKLSDEIILCRDGAELMEKVVTLHREDKRLDLAILDLEMPVLNGRAAAVALRAVERAFRAPPTPFVFFTAHASDERLRRALEECRPARYLHKGQGTSVGMAERLAQVLGTLR